jgi:hypothetical protein
MIIETTDNRFYRVRDTNQEGLDHVWFGYPVKRSKGDWVAKVNALTQLVSKAHIHRVVES